MSILGRLERLIDANPDGPAYRPDHKVHKEKIFARSVFFVVKNETRRPIRLPTIESGRKPGSRSEKEKQRCNF
jgi:hypothetical protein